LRCSSRAAEGPGASLSGDSSTRSLVAVEGGAGSDGRAVSKERTKGVSMPRTGSPSVAARSCVRTARLLRLAALRAFAWAIAYGSLCFLRWVTVEAYWEGVVENARLREDGELAVGG